MKKIFKGIMCAGLAGVLAIGVAGAAGCKNNSGSRNSETDPLRLAIGQVDEKFNPLYYTSLNDGTIAGLTQASLVTTDADGNFCVGDDYPTVALDYVETYYNQAGNVLATGNGRDINYSTEDRTLDVNGSTTYEFLIKNGMKFSNNEPVTVMDVLFNLYVYLDPLYSGSNTIYSTKIKGLQKYRENDPNADEDSSGSASNSYRIKAQERVRRLIEWSDGTSSEAIPDDDPDLVKVRSLFKEELTNDWNTTVQSWVESYKKYNFTEAWQAYYFYEGVVKEQTAPNSNGNSVRFEVDGKYPTTLEPKAKENVDNIVGNVGEMDYGATLLIADMEEATSEAKIDEFLAKPDNADMTRDDALLELQKKQAIGYIYNANSKKGALHDVLRYNVTAGTALEFFMQDEMSKDADKAQRVPNIEGITVSHTAARGNKFNGKTYAEDHDILKIEIYGIDPKAKWNFGIAVAPLSYYSGSYNGVDYKQQALDEYAHRNDANGTFYDGKATHFGVKYKDINFTNSVLAASNKNGVPVGAGPYKCTTYNYSGTPTPGTFYRTGMAYFERNTNFETMGANVQNAKIKYVTYRVISDDKIVNSLKTGEIDYGTPVARATNQTALQGFEQIPYKTGGYGYVGINPKYVPDITVREAIMMAFDPSVMVNYYGAGLVDIIRRPMSSTSWVWDETYGFQDKLVEPVIDQAVDAQDIIDFMKAEGYEKRSDGWYLNNQKQNLKYNFTIAGESTDHPAYQMFLDAEVILDAAGFDISVGNDPKALQKLVTGDLEVWAAAWSSSIDPDPYQIYSIYSNASSTNNWYKDGILGDPTTYSEEYRIAQALNDKITQGRQTIDRYERAQIYAGDGGTLDLVMDLRVEFPTYQRYDLCVFNGNILDRGTMTEKPSFNMGLIDELWKVDYVK